MTALAGALDWQAQSAQTLRYYGAFPFDTFGAQNIDITSQVGPNDQALLIYVVQNVGFTGLPVGLLVQGNTPQMFFSGETLVADQASGVLPFAGAMITGISGQTATLIVSNATTGPVHVQGTLYVFALTTLPVVTPVVKNQYIGQGATTGQVTIGASSTGTLLAAPGEGTYYRIKHIGFTTVAAPASANRVQVRALTTHAVLFSFVLTATANQTLSFPFDFQWSDGIEVNNPIASALPMSCIYEVWNA